MLEVAFAIGKIESLATEAIDKSPNMMIPWYLMLSLAYYEWDISLTSDPFYDQLCKRLYDEFDTLEHWHKHIVEKDELVAGTGYYIVWGDHEHAESRVGSAVWRLIENYMPWEIEGIRERRYKGEDA